MSKVSDNTSYIEWGPVIAGSLIALGVTSILIPFGNAIGLSIETTLTKENAKGVVFAIGLWIVWTQLLSSILGGYFAGKSTALRQGDSAYESEFRDGLHGVLSWCLSTFVAGIGVALAAYLAAIVPAEANPVNVDVNEALAKQSSVIFSFIVAASSLVSAAAAWILGTIGGDHRDKQTDFSQHFSFRSTKKSRKR